MRSNDSDDVSYQKKYNQYLQFLDKFDQKDQRDLWAFFVKEFFHDGTIDKVSFSNDMQTLSLRISCPNIERKTKDGHNSYIPPVWFVCEFSGVARFQMEAFKVDEFNDPFAQKERSVVFLESEINTLTDEISNSISKYGDNCYSIIIKTLPIERNLSLIFLNLIVRAEEPLAFQLLVDDPSIKMPLYIREA